MKNFSTTQATNYASIAGAIVVLCKLFNIEIGFTESEIVTILAAVAIIAAPLISWFDRYSKGDLHASGVRKYTRG